MLPLPLTVFANSATPVIVGNSGNYSVSVLAYTTLDKAWTVLADFKSQSVWAPDIVKSQITKDLSGVIRLEQTYQAPYTFGLPINVSLNIVLSNGTGFKYSSVPGPFLKSLNGQWSLRKSQGGVLVTHSISVDPILPSALRPLYFKAQEHNLRQWMSILKRRMEEI